MLASRNYSQCLKIIAKYTLLSKNKSSQQQLITPNFECLVAQHVMFAPNKINIRTWFFLTCTCLDATDGK